jgi:hypothetical protein
MPRERRHVALTVWPIAVVFAVGLVRAWPGVHGAPAYAASAPSSWGWLTIQTTVVVFSLLAYAVGWSRFAPDAESGHPYRSTGCVRLQKVAGGAAWGLLFAHLILQWVMTLQVGPVAISHYEIMRGFLSRVPVLGFYVIGLAGVGAYLAQGIAASFRAWGLGTGSETSRWLEAGCTVVSAMLALMAVNVLSNFATGRAYWDVSPPAAEKAHVEATGDTR